MAHSRFAERFESNLCGLLSQSPRPHNLQHYGLSYQLDSVEFHSWESARKLLHVDFAYSEHWANFVPRLAETWAEKYTKEKMRLPSNPIQDRCETSTCHGHAHIYPHLVPTHSNCSSFPAIQLFSTHDSYNNWTMLFFHVSVIWMYVFV